jgi:phosphoenolpyruvate synthase/pyruvate phosphate dikinase
MRVETEYEVEDSSHDCGVLWLGSPDCNEFVVGIKEECEMELVGGKAHNLSLLAQEGFPVPQGFCLTTRAYDYFMYYNDICEEDEDILDRILEGIMPPILERIVVDAYKQYIDGKVCAVRSSSPVEDLKNASFAGQYESYLNVTSSDLLDSIRKCWASLWGRKAVEYRKKMGIEEKIKMAVLIQEMVPSQASGVLFTGEKIVIEAVRGLGDVLVGGKAIPDRFVVNRHGLGILKKELSHQEPGYQTMKEEGARDSGISPPTENQVLSDEFIRKLCSLAIEVEQFFGFPQDIEWTFCDGKLFILQARPISVIMQPTVWSRANVAETQPGYVMYLSRIPENRTDDIVLALRPLLDCFGLKDIPENLRFREYVYGHTYLNITTVHSTLGKIPGLSPEVLDQSLGCQGEEEVSQSTMGFSEIAKLLPGTLRVIRFFLQLPSRAEHVIPYSTELIESVTRDRSHLSELDMERLDELVWEMYERNSQVFQVHAVTALAVMSFFGIIQKLTERIGQKGEENSLTIGLEGMSSSQLGLEMWKLARKASQWPQVSKMLMSQKADILEKLRNSSEGRSFLKELDIFLDEFGDRCNEELELSIPRWVEDPSFTLSMVSTYLKSPSLDPEKTMEEQREMRLKATERILNKISNPIERIVFEKLLKKTQEYIVVRENLKTTWVRSISALRFLYLAVAEKLVSKGVLTEQEEIFFLKMTDVSEIISGELGKEKVQELIAERKREKDEYATLEVPEVVVNQPPPVEELRYSVELTNQLTGTGCSHGIRTGKAHVILDPRQSGEFEEGEILVAPITDPGWSPLFVAAGGLVMELGGTLSHGVIIAREYGIPAVVGVKNATKIIKTGQLITVDGDRGIVRIDEQN